MKKRVAVLVSGGGTNLQVLLDAAARGELPHAEIALVVSSKPEVYALERAKQAGIPGKVVPRKQYPDEADYDLALYDAVKDERIDVVVLAGFLSVLGARMLEAFAGRIINVHPALIPAFCGRGYYGLRVHQAALARGVKLSGATVHLVNEETDGGPILLQKAVAVLPDDTPESLQRRVMEQGEWVLLPRAVEMVCAALAEGRPVV